MQIVDLSLRADGRALITGLDLRIREGECWCVVGRNGAGKSTLLKSLAGLRAPDSGLVIVKQKPLAQWPLQELARLRAYLPQSQHDAFGYRAIDTVLAARHALTGTSYWESETDIAAALDALAALDAAHLRERDVRTLSGGERRRVALAALLAQEASLLLLDEPAAALDFAHQASMAALLAELRRAGRAIVMVSHDLNLAQEIATHVLLLQEGGAWRAGAADEMLQAAPLSDCLGYPVEVLRPEGRVIFLPARGVTGAPAQADR